MPPQQNQLFGDRQKLIFDNTNDLTGGSPLELSLEHDANEYFLGDGDGYLPTLGYDRTADPKSLRKAKVSSNDASFFVGSPFTSRQLFTFRLRLSEAKFATLHLLKELQQNASLPIFLLDQRLVGLEQNRTRAKVEDVASPPAVYSGMTFYWPIFKIDLGEFKSSRIPSSDKTQVEFTATELRPVLPTTSDRAVY